MSQKNKQTHSNATDCGGIAKKMNALNINETEKTKEEILAERKAKKAAAKAKKATATTLKKNENKQNYKPPKDNTHTKKENTEKLKSSDTANEKNQVETFFGTAKVKRTRFNLDNSEEVVQPKVAFTPQIGTSKVNPAFLTFFSKCDNGSISGIDAICEEFIYAFQQFLEQFQPEDSDKTFSLNLNTAIQPNLSYLTENSKYPFPYALGNIIRQLKREIMNLDPNISMNEAKETLNCILNGYIDSCFVSADEAIIKNTEAKLKNLPKILIYGSCPLVEKIILKSKLRNKNLEITIVESPVERNGLSFAKQLSGMGIECTYTTLNCVGNVMKNVDIVLLGCSAILSNGYAVSQRGSSVVALVAQSFNVPVLIAAKTYKFVDMVKTFEKNVKEKMALTSQPLETIPDDLITALVTEMRIVPPSSAPAVLKAKQLANEQ
uniref:Translation initiation factor eIF2B subunit delta n=1 Tax=Strongyloides venezuelensis TaxID=75913 RepID=A0A0K0FM61_STRVS